MQQVKVIFGWNELASVVRGIASDQIRSYIIVRVCDRSQALACMLYKHINLNLQIKG